MIGISSHVAASARLYKGNNQQAGGIDTEKPRRARALRARRAAYVAEAAARQ